MELTVCNSGLKVVTKEQGLTEYRAHRITYNVCPGQYPKMFVWVYKHEGKRLKVGIVKRVKVRIALYGLETHHRATERHPPYGITQCHLPPDTGERAPPLTPAMQAGTRFT